VGISTKARFPVALRFAAGPLDGDSASSASLSGAERLVAVFFEFVAGDAFKTSSSSVVGGDSDSATDVALLKTGDAFIEAVEAVAGVEEAETRVDRRVVRICEMLKFSRQGSDPGPRTKSVTPGA
jgi:hypothetical protein